MNKVETKVELFFDVQRSNAFDENTRSQILAYLLSHRRSEGLIRIVSQRSRSQWQNKMDALDRLKILIRAALRPIRKRKRTVPTQAAKGRRLDAKRHRGKVKLERSRSRSMEE